MPLRPCVAVQQDEDRIGESPVRRSDARRQATLRSPLVHGVQVDAPRRWGLRQHGRRPAVAHRLARGDVTTAPRSWLGQECGAVVSNLRHSIHCFKRNIAQHPSTGTSSDAVATKDRAYRTLHVVRRRRHLGADREALGVPDTVHARDCCIDRDPVNSREHRELDGLQQPPPEHGAQGAVLNCQATFLLVFPLYSVVFASLSGWRQIAFLLILPAIKYILKRLMKRKVNDLEDIVPAIVISVDFFHALYQSKCMQSSGSALATAGIIAIDMVQNVVALRRLIGHVHELETLLTDDMLARGVVTTAIEIANRPTELDATELLDISITSSGHFRLADRHASMSARFRLVQDESRIRLGDMVSAATASSGNDSNNSAAGDNKVRVFSADHAMLPSSSTVDVRGPPSTHIEDTRPPSIINTDTTVSNNASVKQANDVGWRSRWARVFSHASVQPVDSSHPRPARALTAIEKTVVLKRTLELLWRCELVLLVEFVEAAIPLLYATYLAILYHLPNARYYPETASMDSAQLHKAIAQIVTYGALELLSLVFVHLMLNRRFKLSPLHQLAFVLESERALILGAFVAWGVIVFSFTLTHLGVDFTFRFAWLAAKKPGSTTVGPFTYQSVFLAQKFCDIVTAMSENVTAMEGDVATAATRATASAPPSQALVAFSYRNPFHDALRDATRWFPLAGRRVQIAQGWRADGRGGTRLGFGASVYDASVALALFLESHDHHVRGRRVIELGCGPGLAGIAAGVLGASSVLLTDGDAGSVELAKRNVELNALGATCRARQYLWGDPMVVGDDKDEDTPAPTAFDVVLGADIVACPYAEAFEALLVSLRALVRPETLLLLAYKRRHGSESAFFARFEHEFDVTEVLVEELHHDFRQGDIVLFRARRKQ
ncbi:hypothetical protein PybrP1_001680 [[Pythium] brassicae (nom. inval.)]|nr:hypothetical protein PybrP1_001680 [[Pythium] brassicae (nom. inval.)]